MSSGIKQDFSGIDDRRIRERGDDDIVQRIGNDEDKPETGTGY